MDLKKQHYYECPKCHTKYPAYIEQPIFYVDTGKVEIVKQRPQKCRNCGSNLIRRKVHFNSSLRSKTSKFQENDYKEKH